MVLFAESPQSSNRRHIAESDVSCSFSLQIMHTSKWNLYKLQMTQILSEDDRDRRGGFCTLQQDPLLLLTILFSDGVYFLVCGEMNQHNHRYWNDRAYILIFDWSLPRHNSY